MISASVVSEVASSSATSAKPPSRLAMSPEASGSPSSAVMRPTTSRSPCGAMTSTLSWLSDRPNDSGVGLPWRLTATSSGATGSPKTSREVMTRNATGWIGTSEPGVSTGRCTPFSPPLVRNVRRSVKLPNSGRYLYPRELGHRVDRPELEPRARHQQVGLVAGFAAERDRVVLGQLAHAEPLGHQTHLGGSDAVDGAQRDQERG